MSTLTYRIVEATRTADTVTTKVTYAVNGVDVWTVDIPHFQPQSGSDILQNIRKRSESELAKFRASVVGVQILKVLSVGMDVELTDTGISDREAELLIASAQAQEIPGS
jgi:hypothetical protein